MANQSAMKEINIGGVAVYPGRKVNARWRGVWYEGSVVKLGPNWNLCRVRDVSGETVLVEPHNLKHTGTSEKQNMSPGAVILFNDGDSWIQGTIGSTAATGAARIRWRKTALGVSSENWFTLGDIAPVIHNEAYEKFNKTQLEVEKSGLLSNDMLEPKPRTVKNALYQSDSEISEGEHEQGAPTTRRGVELRRMLGASKGAATFANPSPIYESVEREDLATRHPLYDSMPHHSPLYIYPPHLAMPHPAQFPYAWNRPVPGMMAPSLPPGSNMPGFTRLIGRDRMNGLSKGLDNSSMPCVWSYGMRETKGIPPHSESNFFDSGVPTALQYPRMNRFKPIKRHNVRSSAKKHSPTTLSQTQSEPTPYAQPQFHPYELVQGLAMRNEYAQIEPVIPTPPLHQRHIPKNPNKDQQHRQKTAAVMQMQRALKHTPPMKDRSSARKHTSDDHVPRPAEYLTPAAAKSPQHQTLDSQPHQLATQSTSPVKKRGGITAGPLKVVAPVRSRGRGQRVIQKKGTSNSHADHAEVGLPVINSSSPSSVKVSSGGSISLSCIAADSSQVSFQWLKDGKRITDCESYTLSHAAPGVLKISQAKPYMAGTYSCIVKNNFGSTKRHFHLEVTEDVAPLQHSYPKRVTYEEMKAALLEDPFSEREVDQEEAILTLLDDDEGKADKEGSPKLRPQHTEVKTGKEMDQHPLRKYTSQLESMARAAESKITPKSRKCISEVFTNGNELYLSAYGAHESAGNAGQGHFVEDHVHHQPKVSP